METTTLPAIEDRNRSTRANAPLVLAALAGGAISVGIGVYGRVHAPTGGNLFRLGFPSLGATKSWLATAAVTLALAQLLSALAMWGWWPGSESAPRWVAAAHRWTGTVAFVVSLPVAYHCLWALGFRTTNGRVVVHSLLGCAFYGAFATKMLALRAARLPKWSLPVLGGLLVVLLAGIWLTSALWFFANVDFPALRR